MLTDWAVWRSNPFGSDIFLTHPDWPWCQPSFVYNGYWVSFPRVKRQGRGFDHSHTPYSAQVKERVELYIYSSSGALWPVLGRTLLSLMLVASLHFVLGRSVVIFCVGGEKSILTFWGRNYYYFFLKF